MDLQKEFRDYICLSFRGVPMWFGNDLVCELPYVNALVNGPLQGSERDESGNHIIDEQLSTFCELLDYHRQWMQEGCPEFMERTIQKRGLIVAAAERMGCVPEFVQAIRTCGVKKYKIEDLFRCYYCNQVFARTEKSSQRECKYHRETCLCERKHKYGCTRLPFHSETPLDIAHKPAKDEHTGETIITGDAF